MLDKSKIVLPTDEEELAIQTGIKANPEAYELTEVDVKNMRPATEVLPSVVERATRGKQKKPIKQATTIRLSPEVIRYFKATGKGWQTRMDDVLKEYVLSR